VLNGLNPKSLRRLCRNLDALERLHLCAARQFRAPGAKVAGRRRSNHRYDRLGEPLPFGQIPPPLSVISESSAIADQVNRDWPQGVVARWGRCDLALARLSGRKGATDSGKGGRAVHPGEPSSSRRWTHQNVFDGWQAFGMVCLLIGIFGFGLVVLNAKHALPRTGTLLTLITGTPQPAAETAQPAVGPSPSPAPAPAASVVGQPTIRPHPSRSGAQPVRPSPSATGVASASPSPPASATPTPTPTPRPTLPKPSISPTPTPRPTIH